MTINRFTPRFVTTPCVVYFPKSCQAQISKSAILWYLLMMTTIQRQREDKNNIRWNGTVTGIFETPLKKWWK